MNNCNEYRFAQRAQRSPPILWQHNCRNYVVMYSLDNFNQRYKGYQTMFQVKSNAIFTIAQRRPTIQCFNSNENIQWFKY